MVKKYLTKSSAQTKKLAEIFAKEALTRTQSKRARVIGLEGDLGGGKTTFLQGFAKGLGIKQRITSPTFVIMKRFEIPKSRHLTSNIQYLIHIDCYRIEKPKEILDFGFKEIISHPKNIVAIEWADRVRKILPKKIIILEFSFIDKNKRKIVVRYNQ